MYIGLVKNHPYSPHADNALYWVGVTQFLYLGETEKSLQTFRLLLKKYPHRDMAPAAQLYIAEIYELGYNDYVRAIEEYRKATHYSDKDVREKSLYSLADNLFRVGRIDDAREHLEGPGQGVSPRREGRHRVLPARDHVVLEREDRGSGGLLPQIARREQGQGNRRQGQVRSGPMP